MCGYTTLWNINVRKMKRQFEACIVINRNSQGTVATLRCDENFLNSLNNYKLTAESTSE